MPGGSPNYVTLDAQCTLQPPVSSFGNIRSCSEWLGTSDLELKGPKMPLMHLSLQTEQKERMSTTLKGTTDEGSAMTEGVVEDIKEEESISLCPLSEKINCPQRTPCGDVSGPQE